MSQTVVDGLVDSTVDDLLLQRACPLDATLPRTLRIGSPMQLNHLRIPD
jgi:hypothetical protein